MSASFLLVTAHPDDESMFFTPTVMKSIRIYGESNMYLLCLSTGNFDGIGNSIRVKELRDCWTNVFSLPLDNLVIVDYPELQDNINEYWDKDVILNQVNDFILNKIRKNTQDKDRAVHICTFDERGVSGHPNHISIARALRFISIENVLLFQLHSYRFPVKFTGPLISIITSILQLYVISNNATLSSKEDEDMPQIVKSGNDQYLTNYRKTYEGMSAHHSQLVWFRRLFILFACYSYFNTLILCRDIQRSKDD